MDGSAAIILVIGLLFIILVVIILSAAKSGGGSSSLNSYPGPNNPKPGVWISKRQDLTSWALHKHPGDITPSDYVDYHTTGHADTLIHREGGINKVVKGREAGRILLDWEVDDYIDSL